MKRLKVAIVEPSLIVAEGIESILAQSGEYDVVCNVRSFADYQSSRADVDVVMLSLTYAGEDVGSATKIGIQTSLAHADVLRHFSAVVSIYSSRDELLRQLRDVVDAPQPMSLSDSHELSERERDVLVLVAKGYTNKEIATELFISPHTVISHRKNIVHKTGIRSVAGLTVYAVLNKLIDSEQL
ncbi:MAG: response regulator transcription factor [Alistipes sp.]|nr:response regulator transcription factor [Alistipes sp.]MBO7307667.1 response regulator transcription factor [Alistipes sp.]